MKYTFFCLFTCIFIEVSSQNLVPNPSFEEYEDCPDDQFEIDLAAPWTTFRQTPDYFHACDLSGVASTPMSSLYGYQVPFHGEGQAGFIAATYNTSREFIGVALNEPLETGQEYFVSMWVSRGFGGGGHSNCDCAVNNLGLKFTSQAYSLADPLSADNFAHIYENQVILDTAGWTQISGWFSADEAYSHLVIGNFFENEYNTIVNLNEYEFLNTYYFLDAVCVATDPSFCEDLLPVNVREPNSKNHLMNVYPNPAVDLVHISLAGYIKTVNLRNVMGQTIKTFQFFGSSEATVSLENLAKGMYIIQVVDNENFVYQKTLIKK